MDYKQLKQLYALSVTELTAKLVGLAQEILRCHDTGMGLDNFDWEDVTIVPDGSLRLENVAEEKLTSEIAQRNLIDYAAIVYCVSTGQKSAEAMTWDAGRKIKQPVLREIVLTICGRNSSIEPLLAKLREPYVDEETFFAGYTQSMRKKHPRRMPKGRKSLRKTLTTKQ